MIKQGIKIFNTLSNKIENFEPLNPPIVKIYACGPTVYDYPHIGNLRTFCCVDFLRRTLEYFNYQVILVINITDVDDKIINAVNKLKVPLRDYTLKYENHFFESIGKLNIKPASFYPRATENIPEMIEIIKKLLEKGLAYKAEDGSIYYRISNFKEYGKLSKIELSSLKKGVRIDSDQYDKETPADFALWKAYTPEDGNIFWNTEVGKGRPGWHIECSAMNRKYLGQPFDIHAGGIDLIFPHHENEIAQSEGAFDVPLAKYWVHINHLIVEGQKMSKSLNNILTINDISNPLALRLLYLQTHYRNKLNFTFENLKGAENALNSLKAFVATLFDIKRFGKIDKEEIDENIKNMGNRFINNFEEALKEDLNTSRAISSLFELSNEFFAFLNKNPLLVSRKESEYMLGLIEKTDSVLGLNLLDVPSIPQEIMELIEIRKRAREEKNFQLADDIRNKIREKGYVVEDTPWGTRCRKL